MTDFDPADDFYRSLLCDARNAFPRFYRVASASDAELMDGLAVAHGLVVVSINAPREGVAPVIRSALERVTNANEQFFSDMREAVRSCPTFVLLSASEQLEIDRLMFRVQHPSS